MATSAQTITLLASLRGEDPKALHQVLHIDDDSGEAVVLIVGKETRVPVSRLAFPSSTFDHIDHLKS